MLLDSFGRQARKLRISVTDRCNFRCTYCMPEEGLNWLAREQLLSFEEITRLARIFVGQGIRKLRLTGGEPLLRKDLPKLVASLNQIPELAKLAITSNGTLLPACAADLVAAGLKSYNISLDSLDPKRFSQAVRREALEQVLKGLGTLGRFEGVEVKLNVVVIRGFNQDEALDFARLAHDKGWSVRFIEFMPLGADDHWDRQLVVPGQELLQSIQAHFKLSPLAADEASPASSWAFADSPGQVGFINSVSEPFCQHCDRIRLTSDGMLRTCLFSLQGTDLRAALRSDADDPALEQLIRSAIWHKEAGHLINQQGFQRPGRTMSQIGG
jgi:cyclic pyranopterin phosphate synthase